MNPASLASERYTTKAYDPARRVAQPTIDELLALLRQAPSSVNSQPWHFVVAGTDEGKARLAKGTQGPYAYNQPKVLDASHVILICARTDMTDSHLAQVLEQEQEDGRFRDEEARAGQLRTRQTYVNLHRERQDLQHWMEKQAYLALGTLLLGAAALGVDATPMEGFDAQSLDAELGLREQGYTSVVMVALGHRSETDFNAGLPKSRLPSERVITSL
ncbi:oxygen-insensitive NAD(P)H-dependent nitroreductase NfsB [Metapseudomonas resinovorans]|uniref:oxygen-insensitive NAD(P)H nitroreductase n=1 Tax=Metapseudomonas resinovorans TaxID=53412 RepID=UPI000984746A|nr:oxygen-insensitive NAD(P)H nitroreductase [Pseudomonas resinovorans]GLZ88063.1 oxygen-insensitive NAD(P)H-dependent nitroreductase NfsB [Pseudomonas resinovorans]